MKTPFFARRQLVRPTRQRGIALIVALILLVVATLTGMAGIRGATLQEKMSGNMYDRSLAMQAAESALRAAEALIALNPDSVPGSIDCRSIDCPVVPINTFAAGDSTSWQNAAGDFTVNSELMGGVPQFFIQRINNEGRGNRALETIRRDAIFNNYVDPVEETVPVFRVTARSATPTALNERAVVVLSALVRG